MFESLFSQSDTGMLPPFLALDVEQNKKLKA